MPKSSASVLSSTPTSTGWCARSATASAWSRPTALEPSTRLAPALFCSRSGTASLLTSTRSTSWPAVEQGQVSPSRGRRSQTPCRYGAPVRDEAVAVASRIKHLIEAPKSSDLVAAYFDATSSFSGDTFDSVSTNDPFTFRVDDLLALTTLDVGSSRQRFAPCSAPARSGCRSYCGPSRMTNLSGRPRGRLSAPPMTRSSNSTPSQRWGR